MRIESLSLHPDLIPRLAAWHHEQWGYLYPNDTLHARTARMSAYLSDALIPTTYVALEGDHLLGSGAIIECDMETHTHLTPWLASLFVHPDHRRHGVGSALVRHIVTMAAKEHIPLLHLFTPDKQRYYERLGWHLIETTEYHGERVSILSCDTSFSV